MLNAPPFGRLWSAKGTVQALEKAPCRRWRNPGAIRSLRYRPARRHVNAYQRLVGQPVSQN